jgi:hypothetical protein
MQLRQNPINILDELADEAIAKITSPTCIYSEVVDVLMSAAVGLYRSPEARGERKSTVTRLERHSLYEETVAKSYEQV